MGWAFDPFGLQIELFFINDFGDLVWREGLFVGKPL